MARDLDGSFEGRDKLHRRALGTFGRIREKLACLSFVDPRIQPVVDSLDDWLARLPLTAPIAGALFNEGMGLALLLSDPERMARHGAGQWQRQYQPEPEPEVVTPPAPEPAPALGSLFDFDDSEPALPATTPEDQETESFFF